MILALQIALGMFSGVVFIGLLQRAYFAGKVGSSDIRFERIDVIVALAISVLFGILAFNLFVSPQQSISENDISGSLLTQIIFGSIILSYVAMRGIPYGQFFGSTSSSWWKNLGWGFFIMIAVFPFIGILANFLTPDPSQEQEVVKFFQKTDSLNSRLLLAFMAVIVAPLVEEIIFRGLLYRILKGYFGKIASLVFTSVLFASIHGNIPTLLPLTLLAFALTAALEVSGSLLVSIAMHATFNAVSLSLILYSQSI